MRRLLFPAVYLMKKLRYPQKFILFGLIIFIPFGLIIHYALNELDDRIRMIEKEREGVAYNQSLQNLLYDFQEHRGMTNAYLRGNKSYEKELSQKKLQISWDMNQLDTINQQLRQDLDATEQWEQIKAEWNDLKQKSNRLKPAENFNQHTLIIGDILDLMGHVGDTSNLLLDSELKNHHLVYSSIQIPSMTERLGQARGLGAGLAAQQSMNSADRAELYNLSVLISLNLQEVVKGTDQLLKEDLYQNQLIQSYLNETVTGTHTFLQTLQAQLLDAKTIQIDSSYYFLLASKAIDSAFNLYQTEIQELDQQLLKQLGELQDAREYMLYLSAGMIFLVLYLFLAFYQSIQGAVASLQQTSREMSEGDLEARVSLDTHDELSLVADSFNKMAEAFSLKIAELKRMEGQLQDQRDFSEFLILNSTVATFVIDKDNKVIIWNKACEHLTGIASKQMLGTSSHWMAFHAESQPCLADLLIKEDVELSYPYERSEFIPNGLHAEKWVILKDGRNRYISLDAAPIYNRKGEVIAAIETLIDMTENKRTEDKIKHKANHDALTGLPNRSYLDEAISKTLQKSMQEESKLALLFLDLDEFKQINDTHGHDMGDLLLQTVSQRLRHCLRKNDFIARIGGDEFVVMLENIKDNQEISQVAKKVIHEISEPFILNGKRLSIGTSVGISIFPQDGKDNETLMKHADVAMYQAKKNGKNRFHFFSPIYCDPDCQLKSCLVWEQRNRKAKG